jgi:hypothetical protein
VRQCPYETSFLLPISFLIVFNLYSKEGRVLTIVEGYEISITRLENAILQVQARFVKQRRQPRRALKNIF